MEGIREQLINEHGSGIIQALIGTAILGVTAAVFSSMMSLQNREIQKLEQKMEILEFKYSALGALSNSSVCACNFDPTKNTAKAASLRFNSGNLNTASMNLGTLYSACNGNSPAHPLLASGEKTQSNLRVSNIFLANIISQGTPGAFSGDLTINFDPSSMILARRSATVTVYFQADVANPSQARITSCSTVEAKADSPDPANSGGCKYRSGTYQEGDRMKMCVVHSSQRQELWHQCQSGKWVRQESHGPYCGK